MTDKPNTPERFDALLTAMLAGEAPSAVSARKKSSGGQSSAGPDGGDCDETQTPPDTSEDASR